MADTHFRIERVYGPALRHLVEDLARLRLTVFSEYPYLYAGNQNYESSYLKTFCTAQDAIIVTARDQRGELVGCSTASSLNGHHTDFSQPLVRAGYDVTQMNYFGESVLLEHSRGNGIDHSFFDQREQHARNKGYKLACFCAIERPADHPKKPASYRDHTVFWHKRGYRKLNDISTSFAWPETRDGPEISHPMAYWLRKL